MIESFSPIGYHDLSGGMISSVDDDLMPDNVAKLSVNFHFDVLGKATQRYGTTKLGTSVSPPNDATGLFAFRNSTGTVNQLIAVFGSEAFAYNGTSWSSTRSGLSTAKVRMASFLNRVFMVGGGASTQSWAGTGSWDSTNLSGAPNGKFVMPFKERLYIAGDSSYPDRIYFSTIASISGVITWNQNTQYFDVNPEDGNNITALAKTKNLLLIFKEAALYRYNGSSVDADVIVDIGTTSQESVANVKGLVYFFNPNGIFVTDGGYPQEISRPVANWIKAVNANYYTNVAGLADEDHYYCSIGDVTVDSRAFTNVWLVYTVSSRNWHVYSFADQFLAMTKYITTAGAVTYVGADADGDVQTLFSGNTDNTSPIFYEYLHGQKVFGSRATTKTLAHLAVFAENAGGAVIGVSENGRSARPIQGNLRGAVTNFRGLDYRGNSLAFKLSGSNRAAPVQFSGFEYIDLQNLGYL